MRTTIAIALVTSVLLPGFGTTARAQQSELRLRWDSCAGTAGAHDRTRFSCDPANPGEYNLYATLEPRGTFHADGFLCELQFDFVESVPPFWYLQHFVCGPGLAIFADLTRPPCTGVSAALCGPSGSLCQIHTHYELPTLITETSTRLYVQVIRDTGSVTFTPGTPYFLFRLIYSDENALDKEMGGCEGCNAQATITWAYAYAGGYIYGRPPDSQVIANPSVVSTHGRSWGRLKSLYAGMAGRRGRPLHHAGPQLSNQYQPSHATFAAAPYLAEIASGGEANAAA